MQISPLSVLQYSQPVATFPDVMTRIKPSQPVIFGVVYMCQDELAGPCFWALSLISEGLLRLGFVAPRILFLIYGVGLGHAHAEVWTLLLERLT